MTPCILHHTSVPTCGFYGQRIRWRLCSVVFRACLGASPELEGDADGRTPKGTVR
jgi:hypothetical protein